METLYDCTDGAKYVSLEPIKRVFSNARRGRFICAFRDGKLISRDPMSSVHVIKDLVEKGANPHCEEECLLRAACEFGFFEVVKYLLEECQSDPTVWDNYPIRIASGKGHADVVECLAQHGANPRVDNHSPLLWAVSAGHAKVVAVLLEYGAAEAMQESVGPYDPTSLSASTEVMRAAGARRAIDVIHLLVQAGGDPRIADKASRFPDLDCVGLPEYKSPTYS